MLFVFLFYWTSGIQHPGFHQIHISKGETHSYELESKKFKETLFFRYNFPPEKGIIPNISVFVQKSNTNSSIFFPEENKFYQLRGEIVYVHSDYEKPLDYQILIVDENSCDNLVFALSLTTYINMNFVVSNESRKLCYIFYEEACDYRVNLDCFSNNRNTLCQIHSEESLSFDLAPETCQSNSTCEKTLANGFIISVQDQSGGVSVLDTSLKVLAVKGQNKAQSCKAYEVEYIDIDGIHSMNKTINPRCEPEKESVIIAVVLVTMLLLTLLGGVLIYYKCRPNRDAYESDEAARRKLFSKSYRRNSEAGTREPDMYTQIGPD